jgi:hypothetical protein
MDLAEIVMARGEGGHGLDYCASGQGQLVGCCEYGNESSGCIKCEQFSC